MPDEPSGGRPVYTKYRARPRLRGRGDADPIRELRGGGDEPPVRVYGRGGRGGGRTRTAPRRRRLPRLPFRRTRRLTALAILGRILLLALGWVVLSGVVFLVSAQIHQHDPGAPLGGGSLPPFGPTNVLVLGSDARPKGSKEPGADVGGPSRSDSILLMRIGGGHNARLSIPRDTVVDIPGHGRQKINAAYAFGGPALAVRTIEDYLGIRINHLVEVNFTNFPDLVDAMGGVTYKGGCVVSKINGGFKNGGFTLRLKAGKTHIDGKQALALARTRKNLCNPRESDLTRARRQQKLFSAMKSRMFTPGAFIRLPFIAWNVPKAIRSDMGGPRLLGLVAALGMHGSAATRVLRPSGYVTLPDGESALTVSDATKQHAVQRFLGG